jgi:hypothetical protein
MNNSYNYNDDSDSLRANPFAWILGQVKIMKEFVWINRFFFLNLAFGQVGEKIMAKTAATYRNTTLAVLVPLAVQILFR